MSLQITPDTRVAGTHGRCSNTEYCSLAASGQDIVLPVGAMLVCPKCSEPLKTKAALLKDRARQAGLALVVLAGILVAGKVTYFLATNPTLRADAGPTASTGIVVTAGNLAARRTVPPIPSTTVTMQPAPSSPPLPAPTPLGAVQPKVAPPAPAGPVTAVPASVPAGGSAPSGVSLLRLAAPDEIGATAVRRWAAAYLTLIGDTNIKTKINDGGVVEVSGTQLGEREFITIASASTAAAVDALLRGSAEFAVIPRRITAGELEQLPGGTNLAGSLNEQMIGLKALAVVVNPANRVTSLSLRQVRAILSGRVRDWAELGGVPGPIHVVAADSVRGSKDAPQDVFAELRDLAVAARVESETAVGNAISTDAGAIGLLPVEIAESLHAIAIADGGQPILPSTFEIAAEEYPLTRRIYLYAGQTTAMIRRFSDYVVSPAAQPVIEAAGFTSLTIRTMPTVVPDNASDRLRQFLAGSIRTSAMLRFQENGIELDSRAQRDIERIATLVQSQRPTSLRVILAGFSDASGTLPQNYAATKKRIDTVTASLARVGIVPVRVAAFGPEWPMGDNATAEGRERNRRVEVYLAP